MSELSERVDVLEAKLSALTLDDLPLKSLQDFMESKWQPNANFALLPGSVGPAVLANIPMVRVTKNTQTIAEQAAPASTLITFNAETFDKADMHNASTNTDRLTAVISGIYICAMEAQWEGTATDHVTVIAIAHNPSLAIIASLSDEWYENNTRVQSCAGLYYFEQGQYMSCGVRQEEIGAGTASLDIAVQASMAWIGPYR